MDNPHHKQDVLRNESNEKIRVAVSSIAASAVFTVIKLLIGSSTNSLGIISEAMHSGLDVIAAIILITL